jgi:hypothetical protein
MNTKTVHPDYSDLLRDFPDDFDPTRATYVTIPVGSEITILRTYGSIRSYLQTNIYHTPHNRVYCALTKEVGTYLMYPTGNIGFKLTYLMVHEDYQPHSVHGTFAGWLVRM